MKILLVDDSAVVRASLLAALSMNGYSVETASDGQDALEKMAVGRPDVVITDLNMPVLDGIGLIQEMRRTRELRFTPALLLTTEGRQDRKDQAKAAGATGWMVKPVTSDKLLDVLKTFTPKR